ncbi:Crp/Fnr family transcriptional regulator [Candidatus Microgenomates bacterium]|nr:Crp/Fnr family transcriptional regulator [Candidatus Microgenomates bacterium]
METPSRKLSDFFARHKRFTYQKGETILRAGDIPQGVYFLERGYVRLYSLSSEGKDLSLIIYQPGDVFPVVWAFFGGEPSIYYFEALSLVVMRRAPREIFFEFIRTHPDVLLEITQHIIGRFLMTLQRMEYLTFGDAYAKIASIVMICADSFGRKEGKSIVIQVPLTHEDVASLAGVTRETASIELKKLERKGLIAYQKRNIVVKYTDKLRKESLIETSLT